VSHVTPCPTRSRLPPHQDPRRSLPVHRHRQSLHSQKRAKIFLHCVYNNFRKFEDKTDLVWPKLANPASFDFMAAFYDYDSNGRAGATRRRFSSALRTGATHRR